MLGVTGEQLLKDLAPDGFQGMGYIGEKSLIMATKGVRVRVVVSPVWLMLG